MRVVRVGHEAQEAWKSPRPLGTRPHRLVEPLYNVPILYNGKDK